MDARRPARIECPVVPDQPEPTDPGRVFDADPVALRDAAKAFTERLAHSGGPTGAIDETYDTKIKIGKALEASAREIVDQPVERSDAAAIRAAERCAVGDEAIAERAQSVADGNARAAQGEDKVTFGDVLTTTMKLPTGKAVTSEVAAKAAEAEAAENEPGAATRPRGVSEALKRAAKHNCEHERAS